MRHHCLLLLSLVLVSYAARRSESALGGWSPIKDVNDSHVAEIANYAVSEYDKRSGAKLTLVKVSKGETQVVAGTNYRLVLKVKNVSQKEKQCRHHFSYPQTIISHVVWFYSSSLYLVPQGFLVI